ncbi:S41 family peptidase [Fulvivirga sedimenti]|uniref:S41 family peptidase n=1 Tax=Fulvivirga sedimenti TaxID=2879465 RepID=A0A9X1HVM3_9BACT|nr:S41 family peptidase [Fulvivirga sedimenti]MCA6079093.1 S41 family peptidase [Fulvivirga sedimenti]
MIPGKHLRFTFLLIISAISGSCGQQLVEKSDQSKTISRINELIIENYVFPDVAEKTAAHLTSLQENGYFDQFKNINELATALTEAVQSINHDKHMRIFPMRVPTPPTESRAERERQGGFVESKVLDGNIGYIKLNGFADPRFGKPAADNAMETVLGTRALIIDLRENGGGSPHMVQYLCSYFFDEHLLLNSLYWRAGNHTEEFWTLPKVNGKKQPNLPLYILTSSYTFSGAEEFCYNMQTRNRATLIGETTGGGANPGRVMRINKDLEMSVPTGSAVNPITGTNWEGTGVTPDVRVAKELALESALELITASQEGNE